MDIIIYLTIFPFCDNLTKCNFASCSKKLLNIFYSSIPCDQENINNSIKNDRILLFKKFLNNNNIDIISIAESIIQNDKLDMFKLLFENRTIDNQDYYFEYCVDEDAIKIFKHLQDSVNLEIFEKCLTKSVNNFEIYNILFEKVYSERDFTDSISSLAVMNINISPIIDVAVNNYGKINNSDHGKTITMLIATNLLVSDDIRLIEITEKYSSSIIQLFILCCQLNKTKCLNLLLQNKTVQQYLLIKFRH